jgi:hypothetical protein
VGGSGRENGMGRGKEGGEEKEGRIKEGRRGQKE